MSFATPSYLVKLTNLYFAHYVLKGNENGWTNSYVTRGA